MKLKWLFPFFCLLCPMVMSAAPVSKETKELGLDEVRALVHQNRTVIIENLNKQVAAENLKQQKSERLPEFLLGGTGYLSNKIPLASGYDNSNSFLYQFNLASEFDVYTGGMHKYAIERMRKEHQMSEENLQKVEQEIELQVYVLLYDIHRNIKYQDFVRSSIRLREKEYERINQLYINGLVLKSDLLRSKLYITDLQKDEVAIQNSINILSDQLCMLLGMDKRFSVIPKLEQNLDHQIVESFDNLFNHALAYSPNLKMHHTMNERENVILKEIYAKRRPQLKLYAQYGVGSPQPTFQYDHQLGGEIGAKLSFSLSSFYKTKHQIRAQKHRMIREKLILTDEEEKLKNTVYELYTRYMESLLNINRAMEKIEMSKESMRILRNSYFNQQALLIDVLESETKTMEASFEWVEAVVDSQKYYWALKQVCGYL